MKNKKLRIKNYKTWARIFKRQTPNAREVTTTNFFATITQITNFVSLVVALYILAQQEQEPKIAFGNCWQRMRECFSHPPGMLSLTVSCLPLWVEILSCCCCAWVCSLAATIHIGHSSSGLIWNHFLFKCFHFIFYKTQWKSPSGSQTSIPISYVKTFKRES